MAFDTSKFENWLKDGLGRVSESPIGNVVKNSVGSVYDRVQKYRDPAGINDVIKRNEFEVSLLILASAVIKADGVTSKFELEHVRGFLLKNFDNQFIESRMFLLEKIIAKKFDLKEVCEQINSIKSPAVRRQLVQFLFQLADADLDLDRREVVVIRDIARYLEVIEKDYRTMATLFIKGEHYKPNEKKTSRTDVKESDFSILGVSPNASEEEIKDAYRSLVKKYHPDAVAHLGEKVKMGARENFMKIQAAYDRIVG